MTLNISVIFSDLLSGIIQWWPSLVTLVVSFITGGTATGVPHGRGKVIPHFWPIYRFETLLTYLRAPISFHILYFSNTDSIIVSSLKHLTPSKRWPMYQHTLGFLDRRRGQFYWYITDLCFLNLKWALNGPSKWHIYLRILSRGRQQIMVNYKTP